MEMFSQGQTAEASLSDEAIFAEPEGQVAGQFQDDHAETTEEAAPAVEETTPEEAAPAGVQAAEAMPVTVPKKTGQTEGVTAAAAIPPVNEKQYREMWRWNTRTATENAALRRQLDEMLADPSVRYLVLDFDKLTFMDSSGIGVILGRYRILRDRGGKMAVCHMNPHIARIFHMSGMDRIIPELDRA